MRTTSADLGARIRSGRILVPIMRLAVLIAAGAALMAIMLIGLFVILPLMLIGGIALYFYVRRRLHHLRQRTRDGVIDAEYTVIDRR